MSDWHVSEEKFPLQTCVVSDLARKDSNQIKLNICLFVSQVPWVDKGRGLDSQSTFNLQTRTAKPAHSCICKLNDLDFLSGMQALLCPARPEEFRLLVWCSKQFTDAEARILWGLTFLKVNYCKTRLVTSICSSGLCVRCLGSLCGRGRARFQNSGQVELF